MPYIEHRPPFSHEKTRLGPEVLSWPSFSGRDREEPKKPLPQQGFEPILDRPIVQLYFGLAFCYTWRLTTLLVVDSKRMDHK
mmetsp:Transcript_41703/g.121006  ORF Transcript_41703/g.121006 Transcript_41703/m.121006 type:complete len:82 (-) Transcript_41703:50-295(-)